MQQTADGHLLRSEIASRGYAELEHGISPEIIERLVDTYADFTLALPDPEPETMDAMLPETGQISDLSKFPFDTLDRSQDTQASWHKYRTNIPTISKPDGYTNRSFQVEALRRTRGLILKDDPKEFFHYTPRLYQNMARQHADFGWGPLPPEVARLDSAFASIHRTASQLIVKVCALIEETHPKINTIITPEALRTSPLRLLFYHHSDSEELGEGHYDKGSLTLQLAESHEGLRIASSKSAPLLPVVRSADKAVFFPGNNLMTEVGEDTPYQPGWHDIIRANTLNQGRSVPAKAQDICARWALIFFTNSAIYVDPGKAVTHNR